MLFALTRKRVIIFVSCLVLLIAALFAAGFEYYLVRPAKRGAPDHVFFVLQGSTLSGVAGKLEAKGIIPSKSALLLWANIRGYDRKIKAGDYKLSSSMSPLNILNILSKGLVLTYSVTIPEGFTRQQIAELLQQKRLADKNDFLSLTGDTDIAKGYGISSPDLEGYLYPDTYQFSRGLPAKAIIDVMVRHFLDVVSPLRKRMDELGLSLDRVVILASIVEKETGCEAERPLIASVFLNRIKNDMRLDSDPTVIYGIKNFNGNLTKNDLITPTPYNTYVVKGIPPGAIANPGVGAINAVLYPAQTNYLYFVSKNDGTHYFSETMAEHNQAVKLYQIEGQGRKDKKEKDDAG